MQRILRGRRRIDAMEAETRDAPGRRGNNSNESCGECDEEVTIYPIQGQGRSHDAAPGPIGPSTLVNIALQCPGGPRPD